MKIVLIYNLIDRIIIIITLIVFHLVLVYFGCSQSSQTGSGNMGYTRLMMLRGTCPCLCRIFFSGSKLIFELNIQTTTGPMREREARRKKGRKEKRHNNHSSVSTSILRDQFHSQFDFDLRPTLCRFRILPPLLRSLALNDHIFVAFWLHCASLLRSNAPSNHWTGRGQLAEEHEELMTI